MPTAPPSDPSGAPPGDAPSWPPPSLDAWRALVDRDLKGGDFDARLVRRQLDGTTVRPLYTARDLDGVAPSGWPGAAPWTRGARPGPGWKIVQQVVEPDPAAARKQLLEELDQGGDGAWLVIDAEGQGFHGVRLPLVRTIKQVLGGVAGADRVLALSPGAHFLTVSAALSAARISPDFHLHLGADPIGVLARTGSLPGGSRSLGWLGDLAAWCREHFAHGRAVAIDGAPWHTAGASLADVIALQLASGVTCLRALCDAGLSIDEALGQLVFRVPVDTAMLDGISSIRALRRCWGRVAQASGASADVGGACVHVVPAARSLTFRDPWVNLLRGTAACFAGACAGADLVTVAPFDAAGGLPGDHARRLARNTQVVLARESHLGRVADPAGGAAFFEARTDALAQAAWTRFQQLEAAGGVIVAFEDGLVHQWLDDSRSTVQKLVARRKRPITGVSEFPDLAEQPLADRAPPSPPPPPVAPELGLPRLPDPGAGDLTTAIAALFSDPDHGFPLTLVTEVAEVAGHPITGMPLPATRLAAPFERLRDRSDALLALTGTRPQVLLACLGSLADSNARAGFASNLLAAGGLQAVQGEPTADLDALATQVGDSGCRVAVLCSSDPVYAELGVAAVETLRAAGIQQVWLAGNPRALPEPVAAALDDAGLTGALYLGCDVLAVLDRAWKAAHRGSTP